MISACWDVVVSFFVAVSVVAGAIGAAVILGPLWSRMIRS